MKEINHGHHQTSKMWWMTDWYWGRSSLQAPGIHGILKAFTSMGLWINGKFSGGGGGQRPEGRHSYGGVVLAAEPWSTWWMVESNISKKEVATDNGARA